MLKVAEEHIDHLTGEINTTGLAEDAAWHFDHDDWLDDETHDVWDAAIEVAWSERYEYLRI